MADPQIHQRTQKESTLKDAPNNGPKPEAEARSSRNNQDHHDNDHSILARLLAAVFYGCASFLIVVVNKLVLTSYKFPSFQFLGLGQMVTGIVLLQLARSVSMVSFPGASLHTFRQVWPLPLFYIGNLVFGLGGTQKLSLPMFTVLRRFSIFLTMVGEYFLLGVQASHFVQLTVFLMIFGAVIAASDDLAFDCGGYTFLMLNNISTAANGVYTKKKLESKGLGKYGLLYYNSLLMLPLAFAMTLLSGEFYKAWSFELWHDCGFLAAFVMSCVMGFVLNYSIILCTAYTSALTTTIIGVLKCGWQSAVHLRHLWRATRPHFQSAQQVPGQKQTVVTGMFVEGAFSTPAARTDCIQ